MNCKYFTKTIVVTTAKLCVFLNGNCKKYDGDCPYQSVTRINKNIAHNNIVNNSLIGGIKHE